MFRFSRIPFATYSLSQVAALPLSLGLNLLFDSVSYSNVALSFMCSAALSLFFAAYPFTGGLSLGNSFMGATLSVVVALVPILLLKLWKTYGYEGTYHGKLFEDFHAGTPGASHFAGRQQALMVLGTTFRSTSLASTILLIPMLLFSGEIQHICRNAYILDVPSFWHLLVASSILSATSFFLPLLLVRFVSPLKATFLHVPSCVILLAVFHHNTLTPQGWINVAICLTFSLTLVISKAEDGPSLTTSPMRNLVILLRNLLFAIVVYGSMYQASYLMHKGLFSSDEGVPSFSPRESEATRASAIVWAKTDARDINDAYLGPRPLADTIANVSMLLGHCNEVPNGSGVDDVVNCLSYLSTSPAEYLVSPHGNNMNLMGSGQRISNKLKDIAHYAHFPAVENVAPAFEKKCAGPTYPFHAYWTGAATWRFELFVKGYLYSQNLDCSELWIWLDSDIDDQAVERMLYHDPLFQRFRSLVDSGIIVLKSWSFPDRIPLPKGNNGIADSLYAPSSLDKDSEIAVADGVIQDLDGLLWLVTNAMHSAFSPVAVSDAVRFIVLHLHGGVYLDMDVLLLRDLRPLLLPDPTTRQQRAFAEQWVERCPASDYNTAVISLPANSSLSSYLLRGGLRMGMNFHPKVIGRMMWKDGRNEELAMLHNAVFDPLVTNLRRKGKQACTVPCHKNFQSSFMGVVDEPENEWSNFIPQNRSSSDRTVTIQTSQDPMNNRTMENFFRGAFAYHIHNQWWKYPDPRSWMDVITSAQDGFFSGARTNAYGEKWKGPLVQAYDRERWRK